MGNGHRVAHEAKVQEGEEHPATEGFQRGLADDQGEPNLPDAALRRAGRLSTDQLQSGDGHQAVGDPGEAAQAAARDAWRARPRNEQAAGTRSENIQQAPDDGSFDQAVVEG